MSEKQGAKSKYKKASEIQASEIKILQGTVFDEFGGLPQGFIGISGQAGAGKTQTLMRLVKDIAQSQKVLVVLTEQNPKRWLWLYEKRYGRYGNIGKENITITYVSEITLDTVKEWAKREEGIIIIDSVSGAIREQNARIVAKWLRNLSEWYGKWVITSLQVRSDNVAGGEGVSHMLDSLFSIYSFTLKPQNKWLLGKLAGIYNVGDEIRLIKHRFDKIQGVRTQNTILVSISDYGVDFLNLGSKYKEKGTEDDEKKKEEEAIKEVEQEIQEKLEQIEEEVEDQVEF